MASSEQTDHTTGLYTPAAGPPECIGRYRVQRLLGQGGFGVVYQAWDEQLERIVAIKVPHRTLVERAEQARRYLDEAQAVAQLDHPHIVPVYDVGSSEAFPVYIVYKFQEGMTLAQRQRENPLTDAEIAQLLATLADALHHAHKHRLVHRDIKPGNVLIDPQGQPHLVDFGIALREQASRAELHYAGTPRYMSPEQARGEGHRVDGRSDIFSLGVLMYELLVGQPPFTGQTRAELLESIIDHDPRPPRQIDERVPKELDRICLKTLCKRTSERYSTAQDLGDDLRQFLADCGPQDRAPARPVVESPRPGSSATDTGTGGSAGSSCIVKIVPKGLRSFDAHDADFFLDLLPGPRDRYGLPESIRFWKHRIEEPGAQSDDAFAIGMICGPSGCGKSSLVKAGLLPRLDGQRVASLYIEATGEGTEKRLLNGLHKRIAVLPADLDLKEALAWLRRGGAAAGRVKVLLVLDQFEQWLHAHREDYDTDLTRALRQCDGAHLQCLLLVREDFWLAATRLLYELEVQLLQGHNWTTVDLFDLRHARKVLHAFGRAYGALPGDGLTELQSQFLDEAVQGLARDGRVISVRLAVFAEMIKSKPWTPRTLRELGGAEGVGVSFLEETFQCSASPQLRMHQRAAREVLAALLPEAGTEIKGHMRSHDELIDLAGYHGRPRAFSDLMRTLDTDLRLITPTDPEGLAAEQQAPDQADETALYYQLTHDYLVPALRRWLTKKKMETPEGRAELLLAERSSMWSAKRDDRHLPLWQEYTSIQELTAHAKWTASQQQMMQRAGVLHARHWIQRLLEADLQQVGEIVRQFDQIRSVADPLLRQHLADAAEGTKAKLHLAMALLPSDPQQLEYLYEQLLKSAPENFASLRGALASHKDRLLDRLWGDCAAVTDEQLLRVAGMLASLDPDHAGWSSLGPSVARALTETRPDYVGVWRESLQAVKRFLLEPLSAIFRDPAASPLQLSLTTTLLSDFAADDVDLLADLVADAQAPQFDELLRVLAGHGTAATERLRAELDRQVPIAWNDEPALPSDAVSPQLRREITDAEGLLDERWALVQRLPYERLAGLLEDLRKWAFRPLRLRPYCMTDRLFVAAVFARDGLPWVVANEGEAPRLVMRDEMLRAEGFQPDDVNIFEEPGGHQRFLAIWSKAVPTEPRRLLVDESGEEVQRQAENLGQSGFNLVSASGRQREGQAAHLAGIWTKQREEQTSSTYFFSGRLDEFRDDACPGYQLTDIQLSPRSAGELVPEVTALWSVSLTWESQALIACSASEHLQACRRMAAERYRPSALSIVQDEHATELRIASVWQRPRCQEVDKDRLAERQANAAVALLRLECVQPVWPLLVHRPDPRLRSYLIHAIAEKGAASAQIIERLAVEQDVSSRRALVLCLGEFDQRQLPAAERKRLVPQLLSTYRDDGDAGMHAAVGWTLRRWGEQRQLEKLDRKLAGRPAADRHWFVNSQGQTFSIIPAPGEVLIGSPPTQWGREGGPEGTSELQHFEFLPHRYAVSSHLVTVAQFLRYNPEATYRQSVSPRDTCPINSVSWYDAAAYCNWLNAQEEIPEDQWCYAPNAEGRYAAGMTIAPDWYDRTGYRLLSEAEWEYACRANSCTANYFGETTSLLNHYAWTSLNSGGEAFASVGTFKPNDFGLFDTVGNIMEWCQDEYREAAESLDHVESRGDGSADEWTDSLRRNAGRGMSMISPLSNIRSAVRGRFPLAAIWIAGLRTARTLPAEHPAGETRGLRGHYLTSSVNYHRSAYRISHHSALAVWAIGFRTARTYT